MGLEPTFKLERTGKKFIPLILISYGLIFKGKDNLDEICAVIKLE